MLKRSLRTSEQYWTKVGSMCFSIYILHWGSILTQVMETNLHFMYTAVHWVKICWTAGWKRSCRGSRGSSWDWSRVVMQRIREGILSTVNPPNPHHPFSVLILLLGRGHLPPKSFTCLCVCVHIWLLLKRRGSGECLCSRVLGCETQDWGCWRFSEERVVNVSVL